MNLVEQAKAYILKHKLFSKNETVIVGVSGGADSVCLLYILQQLQHEFGITLYVAHFNHRLRKTADGDEKFVRTLAQKLNLPFETAQWRDSNSFTKGSLEEHARQARFNFFTHLALIKR